MAIKSLNKYEFKDLVNNLNKVNNPTDIIKNYQIEKQQIQNPHNPNEIHFVLKDFELIKKVLLMLY